MVEPNNDFDPFELPSSLPPPAQAASRVMPRPAATRTVVSPPRPYVAPPPPPPRRERASNFTPPVGREMPWSEEAERHVIACCLLDGSDTIARCLEAHLSPDSFYRPANRLIFEVILDLYQKSPPVTLEMLAEELRTRRLLEAIDGFPYLLQVSGNIPTTAHAGYFIAKVREKELLRDFIKTATGVVEQCYSFTGGMDEFVSDFQTRFGTIFSSAITSAAPEAKPITDFAYPSSEDPNVLLGSDDYLGRGGGMLIVSHGGAGKSSLAINLAMTVGLGEPFHGIRANGKLRVLIVQWEDSERYTGKVAQSFIYKRKLTPEQIATVRENVKCVRVKGVTGAKFFRLLEKLTEEHLPDLVIINPIYLYAEGDISRPEITQAFLVGLDTVNKAERFGYILIHHTGKPSNNAATKGGKKVEKQDWETTYMGFGSSFFANWPRCSMLLEPRENAPGRFTLRLGKAGSNAGVMRKIETPGGFIYEPTTRIPLRYSGDTVPIGNRNRPCIYWEYDEEADQQEPQAAAEESARANRTRTRGGGKYNTSEVVQLAPAGEENAIPLARIVKAAKDTLGMKQSTLMDYRLDFLNTGVWQKNDMGSYYRVQV